MNNILICMALLLLATPASATIFKCRQPDGTYLYADKECPESSTENKIIGKPAADSSDSNGSSQTNRQADHFTPQKSSPQNTQPGKSPSAIGASQLIGNWKCISDTLDIEFLFDIKANEFLRSANVMGMQFKTGGSWQSNGNQLLLNIQWEENHKGRSHQASTQALTIAELTGNKMHLQNSDSAGDTVNTRCTK